MKYLIPLALIPALIGGAVAAFVYFESPRMYVQPNIRALQAPVPPLPDGVVPQNLPTPLPTAQEAADIKSPIPPTPETIAVGKVYYEYYCVFCHGDAGDGNGPVGQSYTPKPADLRAQKYAAMPDGELLRAIMTGTGHEPVLEYTIPPEHRWPLVHFTRQFSAAPQ